MASISVNAVANFAGKFWIAGLGILLVPVYVNFLGIESYGLVGFYSALLGSLLLLDLGLSVTLSRELARRTALMSDAQSTRNLVFSVEGIYWTLGLVIGVLIFFSADFIATRWIKSTTLPAESVKHALRLMALVVAFQWPISLYNGGLAGLQRQVADNIIMTVMSTVRAAGVILILWLVAPTIEAFFMWQAFTSFLYVLIMRIALWRYLPKGTAPKFSLSGLQEIKKFAIGILATGAVTFFLSQLDKIVVSGMVELKEFGYYALAFTIASSLGMVIAPLNTAVFPRLTALVAAGKRADITALYHRSCNLAAALIFAAGLTVVFFANDILAVWTGDQTTASKATVPAQLLMIGFILNSLLFLPYSLLLANGKTKFAFYQNLLAAIPVVPALFFLTKYYGIEGAASVWLAVNACFILISVPLIHRLVLKGETLRWYLNGFLRPLFTPLLLLSLFKLIQIQVLDSAGASFLYLVLIFGTVVCASLFFSKEGRRLFQLILSYAQNIR